MENEETEPGESAPEEAEDLPYENQVTLVGRCSNAPRVTNTEKGHRRTAFTLRVMRGKERTYATVVAWDASAEQCGRLAKDGAVRIEGRLRSWQDKGKKFQLQVVANVVQLLKESQTKAAAARQPVAA